jgi:CelD/BcsL family acetyltransferase involved in cellulose biosynthesis
MNADRGMTLELDDPRWSDFVAESGSTVFHHPAWAQLLSDCYGYRSFGFAGADEGGRIWGGVPLLEVKLPLRGGRRWISLPFTDYCPPVLAQGADGARLASELAGVHAERRLAQVEIRGELAGSGARPHVRGLRHTLPLEADASVVFDRFRRSQVQRAITTAESRGVEVRRGETATDLEDVFYGLHLKTRRRLGVPVQPKRFFRLLWRHLVEKDLGFVLLAYSEGRPIAGAVFLSWKNSLVYKFAASDPAALKLRPNNLVIWRGIEWGCENGYTTLDFGRTDLGAEGLRRFKAGWGSEEEPLVYTTLGPEAETRASGRADKAVEAVIRRSPLWVCRALGELFYRYAA